jgi:hypothetical protein
MFKRFELASALLFLAACTLPSAAQSNDTEFWPEIDFYFNLSTAARVLFADSFRSDLASYREGRFAFYFDLAMKPIIRRELRNRDNVFLKRYLTFRPGFLYITKVQNGTPSTERRYILESTARFPLPATLIVSDRNRGEFRSISGQPFSTRYRNRLQVASDSHLGGFVFMPYAYVEPFYDSRYNGWTPIRYTAGVQVPVGTHMVADPHFVREDNRLGTRGHVNAAALTLNLYF